MKEAKKTTIDEGEIVSVSANEITTTCVEGDNHHRTLAEGAKVTFNGKVSRLDELKVGMPVRVTVCTDDDSKASVVAAGKKHSVPYA